jgi:hypothetical protein
MASACGRSQFLGAAYFEIFDVEFDHADYPHIFVGICGGLPSDN